MENNHNHIEEGFSSSPSSFRNSMEAFKGSTKVILDVGGYKHTTTYGTVCKEKDSMLSAMFSGRFQLETDAKDGSYFIDRDGRYFHHILNWLRAHGACELSIHTREELDSLLQEAKYYQIPPLVTYLNKLQDDFTKERSSYLKEKFTQKDFLKLYSTICDKNIYLVGADLKGLNLNRIQFKSANLSFVNLSCAIMTNTFFFQTDLSHSDFSHTNLAGARFEGCILSSANFTNSNTSGVKFESCNLTNSNFSNGDLSGTTLQDCNLTSAKFCSSNLSNVTLKTCNLDHSDFQCATNLDSATLKANRNSESVSHSCPKNPFLGT